MCLKVILKIDYGQICFREENLNEELDSFTVSLIVLSLPLRYYLLCIFFFVAMEGISIINWLFISSHCQDGTIDWMINHLQSSIYVI
jgi:hypothetical protein